MEALVVQPKVWQRIYYFVAGLLYPGALGVALMWLVQAAFALVNPAVAHPSMWSVFFALWFTFYHSLLFVRLMDKYDVWCSSPDPSKGVAYNGTALLSDVVDSVALFLAFGALGFQAYGTLTPFQTAWLFVAAACVPISAVIVIRGKPGLLRWVLIVVASITCSAGAVLNFLHQPIDRFNCGLLGVLWIALAVYTCTLYREEMKLQ